MRNDIYVLVGFGMFIACLWHFIPDLAAIFIGAMGFLVMLGTLIMAKRGESR